MDKNYILFILSLNRNYNFYIIIISKYWWLIHKDLRLIFLLYICIHKWEMIELIVHKIVQTRNDGDKNGFFKNRR